MKSYSGEFVPGETEGLSFKRMSIPHGHQLPRAPVQGELFFLDQEIDGKIDRPTFVRGLYFSPGFGWTMFSEQFAKRKAVAIGSQNHDIEVPCDIYKVPSADEGISIAAVGFKPEHRLISVSGTASFWTMLSVDGYVTASVFRGDKLVGFTVEELPAKKVRTMSLTFVDLPGSEAHAIYTLKVNATGGTLYVNQSKTLAYDGMSQTAFIVAENN